MLPAPGRSLGRPRGTDGVISPHATVFATLPEGSVPASDEPRVSVGYAMSDTILPEDIGRLPMVEKVAAGVRTAMERAGITDPADVHYVQTKTPLLTLDTIHDAKSRGHDVWTEDTLKSMDVSNSTTALGIAVALGEIDMPTADQIHKDLSLFSAVASCSSGVELDQAQIVVVGNVRGHGGRYQIGHRPTPAAGCGTAATSCWTTPTSVTGDPAVFVSVAAVHQGPSGGGPVIAIVDHGA